MLFRSRGVATPATSRSPRTAPPATTKRCVDTNGYSCGPFPTRRTASFPERRLDTFNVHPAEIRDSYRSAVASARPPKENGPQEYLRTLLIYHHRGQNQRKYGRGVEDEPAESLHGRYLTAPWVVSLGFWRLEFTDPPQPGRTLVIVTANNQRLARPWNRSRSRRVKRFPRGYFDFNSTTTVRRRVTRCDRCTNRPWPSLTINVNRQIRANPPASESSRNQRLYSKIKTCVKNRHLVSGWQNYARTHVLWIDPMQLIFSLMVLQQNHWLS